ncbi:diphthamide synthase (EF-2-diphthine--ammonia ligase) [Pedobacter sp. UYP30]|uniref:hypothetical protein n=1 Tax=Pedobacter sp. UYP30 TaxID=1756400 RepID=UPI003396D144
MAKNGEFHTFAFAGPIFKKKISFSVGEKVNRTYTIAKTVQNGENKTQTTTEEIGYWFSDLIEA